MRNLGRELREDRRELIKKLPRVQTIFQLAKSASVQGQKHLA